MKRLLLLPVLMFGLSFACDRPYEEVYGYKIGCPLDSKDGLKEKDSSHLQSMVGEDAQIYTNLNSIKSLYEIDIMVFNGVIASVSGSISTSNLEKQEAVKKSIAVMISKIQKRWGEIKKSKSHGNQWILRVYIPKEKSEILEEIWMSLNPDGSYFLINYMGRELNQAISKSVMETIRNQDP